MRTVFLLALVACGADGPSLTATWTVVDATGPVDCPTSTTVDVVLPERTETFACTDGVGVLADLTGGQVRAELVLRDGSGTPLATTTRLVNIDGPTETAAVLVLE
jgi:hypothetical protein